VRQIAIYIMRRAAGDDPVRLPKEDDLCRQLRVSRTILREAIKVLAAKGMLEVRRRTGTHIRPPKEWAQLDPQILAWQFEVGASAELIQSLIEVRRIIEPAAAALAAERATEETIQTMEHWLAQMERTLGQVDAHTAADIQFHAAIFRAAGNALLEQIASTLQNALHFSFLLGSRHAGAVEASFPRHRLLAEAIARHDPAAARTVMERILEAALGDIEAVFGRPEIRGAAAAPARRRPGQDSPSESSAARIPFNRITVSTEKQR
jgi:DNA-binding FadR family transcriptional regulator